VVQKVEVYMPGMLCGQACMQVDIDMTGLSQNQPVPRFGNFGEINRIFGYMSELFLTKVRRQLQLPTVRPATQEKHFLCRNAL
jgi:hypothetical protein